jgi:hypothetical protein
MTNPFADGFEGIDLAEEGFMPFLAILKLNENHETKSFDVFGENHENYSIMDMKKLSKYLDIVIDIRTRTDRGKDDTHIFVGYKNCEIKDFTDRKYDPNTDFKKTIPTRLCPSFNEDELKFFSIKNKYTDMDYRRSFSVEMNACNKKITEGCKNDDEIKRFVNSFYFTMYLLK